MDPTVIMVIIGFAVVPLVLGIILTKRYNQHISSHL